MNMLADRVDLVIGVDTHTDTHTASFCTASGGVLTTVVVETTPEGLGELLDAAIDVAAGWDQPRVVWALEGAGCYGAGLRDLLLQAGQEVLEVTRARRVPGAAKNDELDARGIARAALASVRPGQPRRGDTREALRLWVIARAVDVRTRTRLINQFKAVLLTAPAEVRDKFRGASTATQLATAARLRQPRPRTGRSDPDPTAATTAAAIAVLKATAAQIKTLTASIKTADQALATATTTHAAPLLAEAGIGPVTAAQLMISFSHPGRFPHEAAFARLAGVAPKEASSGRTTRHRLDRGGDRQLNAALHRIVLVRRRMADTATTAYITRRQAQGKTTAEINRCLKRALARHLYKIMNAMPAMP